MTVYIFFQPGYALFYFHHTLIFTFSCFVLQRLLLPVGRRTSPVHQAEGLISSRLGFLSAQLWLCALVQQKYHAGLASLPFLLTLHPPPRVLSESHTGFDITLSHSSWWEFLQKVDFSSYPCVISGLCLKRMDKKDHVGYYLSICRLKRSWVCYLHAVKSNLTLQKTYGTIWLKIKKACNCILHFTH